MSKASSTATRRANTARPAAKAASRASRAARGNSSGGTRPRAGKQRGGDGKRSARSYLHEIKTLRDLVGVMLWVQPSYNGSPSCAYCGEQQHLHNNHCRASELVAMWWPEEDIVRQRAVERG